MYLHACRVRTVVIQLKKALLKNLSGVTSAKYVIMQCQNANLLVFGKGSSRLIACQSNLFYLRRHIERNTCTIDFDGLQVEPLFYMRYCDFFLLFFFFFLYK